MAGRPATGGSTWNVDSCSVTATTAQMFSVVGRIESASNAAKMSTAQASRLLILAGRRLAISARATSGSMGGSRSCGFVHAESVTTTSRRVRIDAERSSGIVRLEEAPPHLGELALEFLLDVVDHILFRSGTLIQLCLHRDHQVIAELKGDQAEDPRNLGALLEKASQRDCDFRIGALTDQHSFDFDRNENGDDD